MSKDDAIRHSKHLCEVFTVTGVDHAGVIYRVEGEQAWVTGHPVYGQRWVPVAELETACRF
jgi:hypothetical protein